MTTTNFTTESGITLRLSRPDDLERVRRLAQLDSRRPPVGRLMLAVADGEIIAAVPVAGGHAIADPFRPTAELVDVLRAVAGGGRAPRRAGRYIPWRRGRMAAARVGKRCFGEPPKPPMPATWEPPAVSTE